jgi:cyclin-dependent kinase 7
LYDVFSSKDQTVNMVIENCPNGNLEELLKDTSVPYGAAEIKAWMGMLCRAVYYCHSNFILHRDIKPGNLLIAADGEVKLADFGLARSFAEPGYQMTNNVVTLWYRSPELLFGATHYGGAVDMWSVGVVFTDLIARRAFLPGGASQEELAQGGGTISQVEVICKALGTPKESNWPGVSKLRGWFEPTEQVPLRDRAWYRSQFATVGPLGADLIQLLLKFDPRKRATAKGALEHEYWAAEPRPAAKEKLPKKGGGPEKMAAEQVKAPGAVVNKQKFEGVARKLDFGGK